MVRFAIAGIQMQVSAFEENISQMGRYLSHVRQRFPWVNMVVFSELAALGPSPLKAEPMPGEAESRLCEMAGSHGLWLVPGSLFELRDGQIFNMSPVIDPAGNVIARFRKLFPFRPYEQGVAAGSEFVVFDVPGAGRIGISICYDMWFPETTRTLAAMGAEVILHPTMTDTIDHDVELAIARASAATNQVYFFDINGVGQGGVGRSIVVDPSGYVLHRDRFRQGTPRTRARPAWPGAAAEKLPRSRCGVPGLPARHRRRCVSAFTWSAPQARRA